MRNHIEFLEYVKNYIENNPDAAAYVSDFVSKGLQENIARLNTQLADMEVVIAILGERKFKGGSGLIVDKLEKWEGKSRLNHKTLKDKLKGQ